VPLWGAPPRGGGEVKLVLFGAHVSLNVKLGDTIRRHTLLFPFFTIYFL
jgi:hypothetical protein